MLDRYGTYQSPTPSTHKLNGTEPEQSEENRGFGWVKMTSVQKKQLMSELKTTLVDKIIKLENELNESNECKEEYKKESERYKTL
ncbi:hypothetical protein OUZ56_011694 [Daphnia magna]|uniref:Uncharacterized protein n=1 Tax=Daphnia magna TaxID=35525 RepID=A0ABQ9Z0Y2_9CRUS|nr:hypothetical protein OUZ56_011694 [Daphnia magna]